jgi:hypothetical protein
MVRLTKDEITLACIEALTLLRLAAPLGRLWYVGANAISNAIGYAEHRSRSHDAVIRVYDDRAT